MGKFGNFAIGVLLILLLLSCNNTSIEPNNGTGTGKKVFIKRENGHYKLYKNGKPFMAKGGAGFTYIAELAACGGNTISCWDTSKLAITLQEAQRYNVSVMIGLDIPSGENAGYYKDEKKITQLYNTYRAIVMRYKNHPALLTWSIGNEIIMPFTSNSAPFYKTFNKLLSMIHIIDPDHPVSTSIINMQKGSIINIQWKIRDLDFISINTYNELKDIKRKTTKLRWVWDGPYMVTEWSPNGAWEAETTIWQAPIENTSTKKAEQFLDYYKKYMPVDDTRFLGSLVFYWGSRQEYTHTWFSVFNEDGTPTEVKEVLNDCWKDTTTNHQSVKVKYMLMDSMGARDNIIVSPGSPHTASLILTDGQKSDSLKYHWEILKEDWQYWGRTWNNFKKPLVEKGLLTNSTQQNTGFKAPLKEGPYRIYITVFNNKGYCATANTPFYVVK